MTDLSHLKVGDPVVVYADRRTRHSKVTKVGRKWVYVAQWMIEGEAREYHPNDPRFLRTSGASDTSYGAPDQLYTPEGWERQRLKTVALRAIRTRNLGRFSLETLEEILHLMETEEKTWDR